MSRTTETVISPEGKFPGSESGSSHVTTRPDTDYQRVLFPDLSHLEAGEVPPSPNGLKLAHFEIVDRIGTGGMGSVFLALDQHLQRYVALKILSPAQAREPNAVQRFLNEARSAARLDYDGIARVHYYGEDRGYHFIAFEYVTGTNVRDLIVQSGPLNPADAINFTLQVAHALKHTSAAGVVHRDIKPSNIIVNPAGRAKLVDLGLARKESSGSMEDLTAAGTTLGTFDYISPEQAQDPRNVDVRSDIYSLGCTLYHMLTGEPPYPQGTLAQKLLDHQQSYVPNPADKNRRVPSQLAAVTQKMMASDPKKRYQSPESLIRDLLAVANDQGLRGVTPEGLVWSGGVTQPRRQFLIKYGSWIAAVAALLLIVFGMEWFDPWQPGSTQSTDPGNAAAQADGTLQEGLPGSGQSEETNTERRNREEVPENQLLPSNSIGFPQVSGDLPPEPSNTGRSVISDDPVSRLEQALNSTSEPFPLPEWLSSLHDKHDSLTKIPFRNPAEANATMAETIRPSETLIAPLPPTVDSAEVASPTGLSESPVVLSNGGVIEKYDTLEAACANARPGSIIELRYNGSLPNRTEKPISINRSITIRAAKNYQPVVEFSTRQNPDSSDTRMISIVQGSLNLVGVHFRLKVKDNVSYTARDAWTLFSLQGANQLSLQNVTLTIENPRSQPAVMFEMVRSPGGGPEMPDMKPGMTPNVDPFTVMISETVLRGECEAFVVRTVRPGQINVARSLITVENSLLLNQGATDTVEEDKQLEFSLSDSIVINKASPFRFETGPNSPRSLLHTSLLCEDSLFMLHPIYVAPFLVMSGDTNPVDFRDSISWNGRSNFYHGFDTFRTISDSRGSSELPNLEFKDWTEFWNQRNGCSESDTAYGLLEWTNSDWVDEPLSALTPEQLQNGMDSTKQQLPLASNGAIIGVNLSQLPRPPVGTNSRPIE